MTNEPYVLVPDITCFFSTHEEYNEFVVRYKGEHNGVHPADVYRYMM